MIHTKEDIVIVSISCLDSVQVHVVWLVIGWNSDIETYL